MTAGSSQSGQLARRPTTVTILAVIQLASSVLYGLVFLVLLADDAAILDAVAGDGAAPTGVVALIEVGGLRLFFGSYCAATLVGGILLLRMRRLGWTITMLLTGVGLASSILTWASTGTVVTVILLVQVITVLYLNQRQVKEAFEITTRRTSGPEGVTGA